jgi:hypothetical protein
MRNYRVSLFGLGLLLAAVAANGAGPSMLYVATNGNDGWSGGLPTPNSAGTDGPLRSLPRARDALRARHAESRPSGGLTVRVRAGTYVLPEPLVFEPQDSGTAEAPVIFEAYPGEKPIVSGGRVVHGFRQRGALWETVLPEVKEGKWHFRQLFVNGKRRQLARSPNQGYHRVAGFIPGPPVPNAKAFARDRFLFRPGDLKPFERLTDAYVVLMHSWETSIHPTTSVDTVSNLVLFTAPLKEWWGMGYWEEGQRYYVENALELLDEPGEWYLDRQTGLLTYWPMPGERLGKVEVVAPVLPELVRFAGNPDEGRFVHHVILRGLTFQHADWALDPKGNSSTQAAVEVPAAISADGALNCAIERCEVAHVGTYGIWFRRGCKDCRVQQNRLHDLGAGGIRVGEANPAQADAAETSRTLVDNNHIFDGGHVFAAGIGVWVAQSSSNVISHNDIHDLLYSGMSVGWNWDDAPNRTHHNTIEFNHVHDLGHGVLSDAGLIYCLGVSPGSVIRNNVFHDMWPYSNPAFGWGIYLDATCGGYLVESNVVYNTLSGGLMYNNGGHEHVIQNNIFALSANHQLWPYHEKRPATFRRNIVCLTQGELFIPYGERSLNDRLAAKESLGEWDGNLYWHTGGAERLRFYHRSFREWQELGLDRDSRIADPGFVNIGKADFRLKGKSPARQLGIREIDTTRVGLYGERSWTRECRHAECRLAYLPAPPPAPKPVVIQDDFETTSIGRHPAQAQVSGEESGASIRVSNERASSGKQSLKITDSKALQPSWQPHFFYEPHYTSGVARLAFDVWFATNAQFFVEWRDAADYPKNVGPSVLFDGNGNVSAAGKTLGRVPAESWVHVEIEAALGKNAPRAFSLRLKPANGPPQSFQELPISGSGFRELHWLGFSSTATADTAFFLDNISLKRQIK